MHSVSNTIKFPVSTPSPAKLDHLPLHFNLVGRTVLIVGGGEIARRKAELILRAGAKLRLVAQEVSEEMRP